MNPYSRFGLVSNTVSAATILTALALAGPQLVSGIESTIAAGGMAMYGTLATAITVMVVCWIAMTEAIFPTLFRLNSVRRMILGKYYFEGTWLQSEKGEGHKRLSVIDIQPDGKSFIFSGYSLNEDLEVESNTLIEFSKLEWPFMTYKHRNSLSDGSDGKREGVGEIQFEMNKATARRYNGFVQYVRHENRARIEGAKLTSNAEVKNLRTLQGRQKVFQKYWDLFFNASVRPQATATAKAQPVAPVAAVAAPSIAQVAAPEVRTESNIVIEKVAKEAPVEAVLEKMEADAAIIERRKADTVKADANGVVPRRRTSDWVAQDDVKAAQAESESKSGTGTAGSTFRSRRRSR